MQPRPRAAGLPPPLAQSPFGVVRPRDGRDVYVEPRPEFLRLASRGVLHRIATGYYAVVPPAAHDRPWLPSLEAAAYGMAAADYGVDGAVLMGVSAARLHGAVPRALAVAVVAVPKQRPPLTLIDRRGTVIFVRRDIERLGAERVRTDLGHALVTTIEQTVLDLARRPDLGGVNAEARSAVADLWPRCDPDELQLLAGRQRGAAALRRAQEWVGE